MRIHKTVVKPLCRPPASMKGDLDYIESKYYNINIAYSMFSIHIPIIILKYLLSGYLALDYLVVASIPYVFILFMLKKKAKNVVYGFFLFNSFMIYFNFANSRDIFDAFFAPLFGLCHAWARGISKKWLIIYSIFTFFHTWLVVQHKVVLFVQNASKEEIIRHVQFSFSNMLTTFVAVFSYIFFKVYVQEIIREKWLNLKKKIADQNEALQKTNEQLTKVIEERETFILSFSHETRNPLNGLLGNLHILSDMKLPEDAQKIVNKAQVCSKILKNIVLTILDSRKSGNSVTNINLTITPTNMKNFIEDMSMLCRDLIEAKGLMSMVEITPFFPETLNIDPERLTQVIMNLVSNAIKFTQKGSIRLSFEWIPGEANNLSDFNHRYENSMYLTACNKKFSKRFGDGNDHYNSKWFSNSRSRCPGTLKLTVTDSGIGISKADLERIFEKFAQVESNTELKSLGLGLGLWISKAIVHHHKGQILVDSEEGSGSSFTVTIPTTTDISSAVAACPSHTSSLRLERSTQVPQANCLKLSEDLNGSMRHMRALVIEDCAINQAINRAMLNKFGIQEVHIAPNGLEGVKLFKEKGPQYFDIVTVDLEMPVMKGKEAIMEIRKWEHEQKLPPTKIVIISGNAVEREIQECLNPQGRIRADEFLTKPCDYPQFAKKLSRLGADKTASIHFHMIRKKILVADDDYFNLDIVKNFAKQLRIDCLAAKNGKEALRLYEQHADDIAIVLLDYEMPILNGVEVCKEIRKLTREGINHKKNNQEPQICLLSGHHKDKNLEKLFDECVQKPMTFETFKLMMSPILQ